MPWFRVIGVVFDYVPKGGKLRMRSFPNGGPYFGSTACVDQGLNAGRVVRISKPEGFKVDKRGEVVKSGPDV